MEEERIVRKRKQIKKERNKEWKTERNIKRKNDGIMNERRK